MVQLEKAKYGNLIRIPNSNSDPSVIDIANVEELPAVTEEATTTTTTTTTTEKEEDPTTVRSSTRDEALFSQMLFTEYALLSI